MNFTSFLLAFWLGIAFSAPPGVINIETVRQGLRNGYWPALAVGLGSLIGDGAYAILAFNGLGLVAENNIIKFTIGLIGICFLIYLAISTFRIKNLPKTETRVMSNKNQTAFVNGVILSLTNPWAIAFWLSFGGIFVSSGISTGSQNLWFFLATFLAGTALWVFIFSGLIVFGKKYINDRMFHIVSFVSGLIFLGTAGYAIWQLLN